MEYISTPAYIFWIHLTTARSVMIFTVSTALLLFGLSLRVWFQTVRLAQFEVLSLKEIENKHPYIPSLRIILITFLIIIALLVVCMETIRGVRPFDGPYESLYLMALFIYAATAGVLGELKWDSAKDYPFAFIVGTAVAFIFLVFKYTLPTSNWPKAATLLMVLIGCIALSWRYLLPSWSDRVQVVAIGTFIGWLLLFMW